MNNTQSQLAQSTFAGGCFWCMEAPFRSHSAVQDVVVGYIGGHVENPTYEQVCGGQTGHFEAVQITYLVPSSDENDQADKSGEKIYQELLDIFWQQIDPTDAGGAFADRGTQYRTAVFYHNPHQQELAKASKAALEQSGKFDHPIATLILPAQTFYPAEDYHQKYHAKNPLHYTRYRVGSGRADFLEKTWGKLE